MARKKYDHYDEALIFANLHLPPREIESLINIEREARGLEETTFTKLNKQTYKHHAEERDILDFIPELEAEQRARELKHHLETLQDAIDIIRINAKKKPSAFGKGEARELGNLSREFRNTLQDIGALSPGLLKPKVEEEKVEPTQEEKYRGQVPKNVTEFPRETGTD